MNLSWSVPEYDGGCPISKYHVERTDASRATPNWLPAVSTSATEATVDKLRNDLQYRFRVCAENQAGRGEWLEMREPVLPATPVNPPGPPESLDVTGITSTSCLLSWRRPTDNGGGEISGYRIETRKESSSVWELATTTNGHTFNYKLMGLDRDGDYRLRIMAENKAGKGEPAEIPDGVHLRPPPRVPDAPEGPLVITPETSTSLTVTWSPPKSDGGSPLTSYTLLIRDVTRTAWLQAASVDASLGECTASIRDLSTNSEYFVRVVANNAMGASEPLASREPAKVERPRGAQHPPGACPPPLKAEKVTGTSVTLKWEPPTDDGGAPITDYILWRRDMSGKSWEELAPVPEFLNEFTVSGLKEGARYMFRVAAKNVAGVGETIQMKEPVHCKKEKGEEERQEQLRIFTL